MVLPPEECLCEAHVLPEVIQVQRPLSIHSDDDDDGDDVEEDDDETDDEGRRMLMMYYYCH